MRKVIIYRPGGHKELQIEDFSIDEVGKNEVVVENEAASVNYADCIIRMGLYKSAKEYVGWPITPGFDFAGKIFAVGSEVKDFSVGQEVVGVTRFGAYASHVRVPAKQIFPLPDNLSATQAAAIPAVFLTAYYGLCQLAGAREGMKVLVHSAAGGVGGALLQLGKLTGCQMVGVVSTSQKKKAALQFGADEVIVKREEDLWLKAREYASGGYDVILDANGVETLKKSYQHLASGGKLVVYGFHSMFTRGKEYPSLWKLLMGYLKTPRFNPLDMTSENKSVLAFNLSYMFHQIELLQEAMGKILGWFQEEKLQPPIIQEFPLEEVDKAHQLLESGQSRGKIVLKP